MKFEAVVQDIKKLIGKEIHSIRPGANIQILRVDSDDNKIELIDAKGKKRVRTLDEIRRVWEKLCSLPAVHVDSVLGGSGSSRNQPETILANLPYVEVIYLSQKKHLAYMGSPTHPIGTLKEMDSIGAHKIRTAMQTAKQALPSVIIIVNEARPISSSLEAISGLPPVSVAPGTYIHKFNDKEILVVGVADLSEEIPEGVYVPLDAKTKPGGGKSLHIGKEEFSLIIRNGINILIRASA